ncbi:Fic family protein [Pseudokineococcus basanitobsidens]|uniref:Fic family protein n=1 Tax=Pseudokineococcus basanitobsidens TaxID=1926649 RepID=A0ABU8RKF4_9ACTN
MAGWSQDWWDGSSVSGLPARDRRSGDYRRYLPDPLAGRPFHAPVWLERKAAAVERRVRDLGSAPGVEGREGVARFLLRSEAIASSRIEGIAPSPQQVALAELAQEEPFAGVAEQARLVANNIAVLRSAASDLATADEVTVPDVEALQRALLPEERYHGLRAVQNWIGGSSWHPLDAEFVPPPAADVPELMDDLVTAVNGSAQAPLVQAALVHAQFETIHPFTDGNGRVGRALVHTVLRRRGLTPSAVLPVSLVLLTLGDRYVEGLTAYRYGGDVVGEEARSGTTAWLDLFLEAADVAASQAAALTADVAALRRTWGERVKVRRDGEGRRAPRADSATARLLRQLPEAPVLTARAAQRLLGVAFDNARSGLEELAEAEVLQRRKVDRGTTAYLAGEVFDLLGHTERRLASTQWDTRLSPPVRPVPARPQQP